MDDLDQKYIIELEKKILEARFIVLHCNDGVISNVHRNKLLEILRTWELRKELTKEPEQSAEKQYEESIF